MKKKLFYLSKSALISVLFLFVIGSFAFAYTESVKNIKVIKISSQDERAIVRAPDGRMKIIKVGDILRVERSGLRVPGEESEEFKVQGSEHGVQNPRSYELRVVEITSGRIVFEEMTDRGLETVIVRVEDGKQKIERIGKTGEERPILYRAK